MRQSASELCLTILIGFSLSVPCFGDWPRFRGAESNGICEETGLITELPEDGLPLLWQIEGCGTGYSSLAIVDNTIYTMGDLDIEGDKSQYVIAFDVATQERLWTARIGPPHGDGSRCTPTVDGEHVYALGTSGDLVCLNAKTGAVVWQKNLKRDFDGQMMSGWRWSESPLVDGDRVICTPGASDAMLVALNKTSGEVIWKCSVPDLGKRGKDGAGYASIIAAEIDGVRQYITIVGRGAIGVAADTGQFLWGYNDIANDVANIPSPVVRGNQVFVTTSYKTGSALLELKRNGDQFDVREVYFLTPRDFENHHGGVILVGDYLYGGDGQNNGTPVCLDFATGEIKWKEDRWKRDVGAKGSAAVLYADGHLLFRFERDALLALVEATPEEFRVKGVCKAAVDDGPAWAHPVIYDGKLFLRANNHLMCYDMKKKG